MLKIGSIHFDPVVPHQRFDLFAREIEDDEVGFLFRHVAVDAVGGELVIGFGEGGGIRFVAGETALRELFEVVL